MKKIYLYKFIKHVACYGLQNVKTPHDRKSLLFINKMSMINTLLMTAFSVTVMFMGLYSVLLFTLPFLVLFALPPLLNSKGKLFFCRYYFSILPLIFLIGMCVHNGSPLGDKYLVLTTATIPLLLFTHKKTIYGLFAANVGVFFLISWYQSVCKPLVVLPEFLGQQYYIYVQLTVFTVIFSVVQSFRKDSEEYEEELEEKNKIISEKNHEIIDSIVYARRLQEAIIPPEKVISESVPESFILYKPKDIVAGDFYFADHKGDYFFLAVADCTGHGVPGAMVSMVCSNALNRAVEEFNLVKPGEILDKVTELVVSAFKKGHHEVKDGMDVSLCVLNTKTHELAWAGANNPLWYIPLAAVEENTHEEINHHSTEAHAPPLESIEEEAEQSYSSLQEITATKQPVGKSEKYISFTTHVLNLAKGSLLYLFTDGFADQFGGPKGKKFKYKQLSDLIFSNKHLNMKAQRELLEKAFNDWKGSLEQIDDVCIIGIRL
jgi:serine phosphatase RsbU (regulator of sigma subunit)